MFDWNHCMMEHLTLWRNRHFTFIPIHSFVHVVFFVYEMIVGFKHNKILTSFFCWHDVFTDEWHDLSDLLHRLPPDYILIWPKT